MRIKKLKINLSKAANFLTFILLVLAFVLGYKIYSSSKVQSLPNDVSIQGATPKPKEIQLSDNDLVLVTPQVNASEDEKKKYEELVRKLATESDTISLSNCKSIPTVSLIKEKEPLRFKNTDPKDHTLTFYNEKTLEIKQNATAEILLDYDQGPGIYAYGCDRSSQPTGILYVTKADTNN